MILARFSRCPLRYIGYFKLLIRTLVLEHYCELIQRELSGKSLLMAFSPTLLCESVPLKLQKREIGCALIDAMVTFIIF